MAEKPNNDAPFGLTQAEYDNFKQGATYIASIVLAVVVTFLIVLLVSGALGIA